MNFIENESAQKLRGGYYTPIDLATFLVRWVKELHPKKLLEPSCGDGAFFQAMAAVEGMNRAETLAFEIEPEEAAKAIQRAKDMQLSETRVLSEDFLRWALAHFDDPTVRFDAVIGNPPFVRYQYLPEPFQALAEDVFRRLDLPFTKHTNAWVPFILASIELLRPGGRLAMVVPAELIHVTHAQSLRSFLGRQCRRLVIVDPEELWFADTLQGAVLLLAEKKALPTEMGEGLGIYPVRGREFVSLPPADVFEAPESINGKTVQGKWTRALLDRKTRKLFDDVERQPEVHRFSDVAEVDVGIVTGANKFFLVPDEVVKSFGLRRWAHPMFGRSEHCPGIIYDERQHEENVARGLPTNFLWFNEHQGKIDKAARAYIEIGEEQRLHTRYKCRVRAPWYTVPSVYSTEVGMLKRSHTAPRLILNRAGAYTTDTAYRIRTSKTAAERLVGCFLNPLTALSAELEGRHYGGGVLELVPSEIEKLLLPLPQRMKLDLAKVDRMIRTASMDEVLSNHGQLILGAMGLQKQDQDRLIDGWRKLRDRRHRTSEAPDEK